MAKRAGWLNRLKDRYGRAAVENLKRRRPADAEALAAWRDEIDPHYTRLWFDFTYGGLLARKVLDERTRALVTIAQFTVLGEIDDLDGEIRGAVASGVDPRHIFEAIIQASVYCGNPRVNRAGRRFAAIAAELGLMDALKASQMPIEGPGATRRLEDERPKWGVADGDFPRREELMKKYGWQGISAGLRLQQKQHADAVDRLDRTDSGFLQLWLDFIYEGMYSRGVLDDRTRILCMVGDCVAMRETTQGEHHMKGALRNGATPREVLEVLLQSTQHVGMVGTLSFMRILMRILEEQGRLGELKEPAAGAAV